MALAGKGSGDPGLCLGPAFCCHAVWGTCPAPRTRRGSSSPPGPVSFPSSRPSCYFTPILSVCCLPQPLSSSPRTTRLRADCPLPPQPLPCVLMTAKPAAPRLFPGESSMQPGEMLELLGVGVGGKNYTHKSRIMTLVLMGWQPQRPTSPSPQGSGGTCRVSEDPWPLSALNGLHWVYRVQTSLNHL